MKFRCDAVMSRTFLSFKINVLGDDRIDAFLSDFLVFASMMRFRALSLTLLFSLVFCHNRFILLHSRIITNSESFP